MDELLKYLIENGKINLQEVDQEIKMKKREELLKQHNYDIWQGTNGKWYTYLPDKEKGRVQRERKSKVEIEKLVIAYYKEQEENPTIRELFYQWLDRRIDNKEIEESTYTRYVVDFERCFHINNFDKEKIKNVEEIDIEYFLKSCVQQKQMTKKAYSNIRTLVYGIFKYAKKKHYITYSIKTVVDEIEFNRKEFRKIEHKDIEQVFFLEEERNVIAVLKEAEDIVNLGLLLLFKSGLRIGELCALKESDIEGNLINVNRTETIYNDRVTWKKTHAIKEYPKTEAGIRHVILKDEDTWILERIKLYNPHGEYLFMRYGKRICSFTFRKRLYAICKKGNAVRKSPHKIRKTYGTKLYNSDVTKSLVCKQMGHTDITCLEKYYYFNRNTEAEKIREINERL